MRMLKTAIGLMSGTSMDGIDAVLLQTDGRSAINALAHYAMPYSAAFRQELLHALQDAQAITAPDQRPGNLLQAERELTLLHARAIKNLLAQEKLEPQGVDIIGFHGQTVIHCPPPHADSDSGFTVQLGDGSLLAREANISVIADMRAADMRAGGNGAPLAPVYHRALAASLRGKCAFPLAFINIGGIANVTYIENAGENNDNLIAFDCGAGNCLIDQWAEAKIGRSYDKNGEAGLKGKISEGVAQAYFKLPIFKQERRSYDRNDFPPLSSLSEEDNLSYEGGAATLAYITAEGIIHSFSRLPQMPKTLIVSGGGIKNRAIMQNLARLSAACGISLKTAENFSFSSAFMEAEAWAYLAVRSFYHLPLTYPQTTGCRAPVSGGVLYPAPQR